MYLNAAVWAASKQPLNQTPVRVCVNFNSPLRELERHAGEYAQEDDPGEEGEFFYSAQNAQLVKNAHEQSFNRYLAAQFITQKFTCNKT